MIRLTPSLHPSARRGSLRFTPERERGNRTGPQSISTYMEGQPDLGRERFAVAALRSVEIKAPPRLRQRIEAERVRAHGPARRRRLTLSGAVAGATAAAALLVVLLLPSGAGGPSVVEAAALGTRPPTAPAPQPGRPKLLDASAFGLPFPDWAEKFGWEPSGRRVDELDGRRAVTVFYEKEGRRIGYTILSGDPIDPPGEASTANREGLILRGLSADGRVIVTWLRGGHTCVLSGTDSDAATLLDLAAWQGKGAVEF